jgi:hypothetical protein
MARTKRSFTGPDGTAWRVDVRNPGASNAHLFFVHPDPRRTRENRYAHVLWRGAESLNTSGRLDPVSVLDSLSDEQIAGLFRRSMPVAGRPTIEGRVV